MRAPLIMKERLRAEMIRYLAPGTMRDELSVQLRKGMHG